MPPVPTEIDPEMRERLAALNPTASARVAQRLLEACERDYWDVELKAGELYRLYRDHQSGEWYADGIYD